MLKSNRPRTGYHIISNDGLVIANCILQIAKIGQITNQCFSQGSQGVRIDHIRDAISQRCQSVFAGVNADKIAQRNIEYLATVNLKLIRRIAIEQHIKCQFNQHCLSRRCLIYVKEERACIKLNGQVARGVLLEAIEVVGNNAIHLRIAAVQELGNISVIFTAGDHDITRKSTCHTTYIVHTKGSVNNRQITCSGDITVHGKSIEIENRGLIKGKIARNIARQNDNRYAGQLFQLGSQIGRQAHFVDRVICLDINVHSLILVAQIGQGSSGRHRNTGLIFFDHSRQIAKSVNGTEQLLNGNYVSHLTRGLIVRNLCGLILFTQSCIQCLVFSQIHFVVKHLHRVGQRIDRSVTTENRIYIILDKANRNFSIIGVNVLDIHVAGDQKCSQISFVCLLGHREVQIHLTIRHGEIQVVIKLLVKQISCLQHFGRNRTHSNMEGNRHSIRSIVAQLHGCRNQFATECAQLFIGNNVALELHVLNITVGVHHVQQRIRTKAAVHNCIKYSLQRDCQAVLLVHVNDTLAVHADIAITRLKCQRHDCTLQCARHRCRIISCIDLHNDGIIGIVFDQNEGDNVVSNSLVQVVDHRQEFFTRNIYLVASDSILAIDKQGFELLCGKGVLTGGINLTVNDIVVANCRVGSRCQINFRVVDVDDLIVHTIYLNSKLFGFPGIGKVEHITGLYCLTNQSKQLASIIYILVELSDVAIGVCKRFFDSSDHCINILCRQFVAIIIYK